MGHRNRQKHLQQGPPQVRVQKGDGPAGGAAGYRVASADGLAGFFKRQFLPTLVLLFLSIVSAALWFFYRPPLEIVGLTVVLLALVVGGGFWLVRRKSTDELGDDAPFLNETHDRRDYSKKPPEEVGSLITQAQPSQKSGSSENAPWAELKILRAAYKSLEKKINEIDARLAEFERERYYPTSSKPLQERRPSAGGPASPPPRRPAPADDTYPAYDTYEKPQSSHPYPSSIDLSNISQAVCRFLADQTGGWEVERLVQSVRGSMGGNSSINVEHLVPHSSGEWRLVALWPQNSQEGLVLVSSGELVDDDIARYFDVGFGRRIIGCRQPARVSHSSGGEIMVLQKGRVESS